jgi:sugar phosphate isomerase/epimerase
MTNHSNRRLLSTYRWISHKLSTSHLTDAENAGIDGVEIFCSAGHFNYRDPEAVREIASWFGGHQMKLHSLHAPTSRDFSPGRESGSPVSVSDLERMRRLDAVDEIKRALEVAEKVPFEVMVLHFGGSRDSDDPRRWDVAFSSLESLALFARQRGVTLALENTPSEMAKPANLKHFLEQTRLPGLRLCFDSGHAQIDGGAVPAMETMGALAISSHLHDNHGDKDEHLLPYAGTIEWKKLMKVMPSEMPLLLELREQPNGSPTFDEIRAAFDALEQARENSE